MSDTERTEDETAKADTDEGRPSSDRLLGETENEDDER